MTIRGGPTIHEPDSRTGYRDENVRSSGRPDWRRKERSVMVIQRSIAAPWTAGPDWANPN